MSSRNLIMFLKAGQFCKNWLFHILLQMLHPL